METLTGVRFPVGIGRAARGVRSGYSLRFSDKLVVSSRKKQKKGCDTPVKRSVDALRDGRQRTTWAAGKSHRGGENAEGTGENTYRAPAFHACRKRTVLRPFDAYRATRMDAPATITVGRFSPGSGGENGKDATDRKDRSGRRSWTFDRKPDRGNAPMIRFSVANPSRAYSRTNISVRCPKPSEGV